MTTSDADLREQTKRSIALLVAQRRGVDDWEVEDYWTASNILMVCDRLIKDRDAAKERDAYDKGWADGWAQRGKDEDYSALIGKLKAMKPQENAFFLIGEIERAVTEKGQEDA